MREVHLIDVAGGDVFLRAAHHRVVFLRRERVAKGRTFAVRSRVVRESRGEVACLMPLLRGVAIDERVFVEGEMECAVIFDAARCESVRQSVIAPACDCAFRERCAKSGPVARDVPAKFRIRCRSNDGDRIGVGFCGIKKNKTRQITQPCGDLGRSEVERDAARQ